MSFFVAAERRHSFEYILYVTYRNMQEYPLQLAVYCYDILPQRERLRWRDLLVPSFAYNYVQRTNRKTLAAENLPEQSQQKYCYRVIIIIINVVCDIVLVSRLYCDSELTLNMPQKHTCMYIHGLRCRIRQVATSSVDAFVRKSLVLEVQTSEQTAKSVLDSTDCLRAASFSELQHDLLQT